MPRQLIAPDATIGVDPAALPRTLRAPARVPLGADIGLVIQPGLKVEEQTFR